MIEMLTEILKKIKIDIKEIFSYGVYVCFAIVIYLLLPEKWITYIFNKLTTNRMYNIIILIIVLTVLLYFITTKVFNALYNKIKLRKKEEENILSVLSKLNTLNKDSMEILSEFYDTDTKKFKEFVKIMPKRLGLDVLEQNEIIIFSGPVDEYGGYSIRVKQFFGLSKDYYDIMNSKRFLKHNSKFINFLNHKSEEKKFHD